MAGIMELLYSWICVVFAYWPLILLFLIAIWYWKLSSVNGTWRDQGIPGPHPVPILGVNPFRIFKIGTTAFLKECALKYGKICGLIIAGRPVLLVTDPEMVKQIFIKDFSNFTNRVERNLRSPVNRKSVIALKGDDWKRVRSIITPIFSASKMKQMVPLMNEGMDTLVRKLGESADRGETVNLGEMYGKFTMETIFKSAFGIDAKNQSDPDDKYTKAANDVLHVNNLRITLTMFVPFLNILAALTPGMLKSVVFLFETANKMIETRRKDGHPARTDLLKLMMDAEVKTEDGQISGKLTDSELKAQCLTFLVAGYETTSSALTLTSYALATHQEIQDKLIEEIDEFFPGDSLPDYETVSKLGYLDKVLNETLRMYPPAQIIGRQCKESCTVGGVNIPEGTAVAVQVDVLHHDPEIWENPDVFDPERFSPEAKATRHQFAHIPFSLGPRNCVGMRFAILEFKTAMVRVLKKFRIEATTETSLKCNTRSRFVLTAEGGIWVKFVKREL